jgi:hypothetical protein
VTERVVRLTARALTALRCGNARQCRAAAAWAHADFTGRADVRPAHLRGARAAGTTAGSPASRAATRSAAASGPRRAAAAARPAAAGGPARSGRTRSAVRRWAGDARTAARVTSAGAGLATRTPDLVGRAAARAASTALSAGRARATAGSPGTRVPPAPPAFDPPPPSEPGLAVDPHAATNNESRRALRRVIARTGSIMHASAAPRLKFPRCARAASQSRARLSQDLKNVTCFPGSRRPAAARSAAETTRRRIARERVGGRGVARAEQRSRAAILSLRSAVMSRSGDRWS